VSRRLSPAVLLPLAAALALTGCAGKEPDAAAGTTSSAAESSATEPSDEAPRSAAGQQIQVQIAGGQVTGDTGRVPVAVGTEVTLTITSDVADEVHLHGYDLEAELTPGTPAEITVDATLPGVFEVELHEAGTVLLTIQVS
jgi:plastocyanin